MEVWTIGHWNHPRRDFLNLLFSNKIETLIDIRSFPGSRRSPHFNKEDISQWLPDMGIGYLHCLDLGGRRKAQGIDPDLNAGWVNRSFHNYADYAQTPDFEQGIQELIHTACRDRVAIMCGEPVPWRCHRSLVSNVLVARGWGVHHILPGKLVEHTFGKWGAAPCLDGDGHVVYPLGQISLKF